MKISASAFLAATMAWGAQAQCTDMMEMDIGANTRLAFSGFIPTVTRVSDSTQGNKVVFKSYGRAPLVEEQDGVLTVTAGELCGDSGSGGDPAVPAPTDAAEGSAASYMTSTLGFALPVMFGMGAGLPATTVAAASALGGFLANAPTATAQDTTAECELVPIEVEIYTDATSDEIVMRESQSGDFETCPPESLYWKHHPSVYGGYEGCVGEKGYFPCAQDSQGMLDEEGALAAQYPLAWDGTSCVETGFSTENRTYWILWGDPLDKFELNKRTGLNPVVSFPFNRGPYPAYDVGVDVEDAFDDSADARAMAKDFLAYLDAFTEGELVDYDTTMTEGAESGMVGLWAAKALEIARTTCTRDIYVLQEVPAYSYAPSDSAAIANQFSDTFYNGEECACFNANATTCNDKTITITVRGWLPLTPFPEEMGADGVMYPANSDSPNSPWFESMVWPENPTGKLKTPQIADSNRRVCDGVYVWPMYFGMTGYEVPTGDRPDCASWSFSITKGYSASVRAGFVVYKEEPVTSHDAVVNAFESLHSMTNGLYSEWSWYGQMQLWEMIMSRPISDPTSWVGAYTEIMDEKWNAVISGFENCPVLDVTNAKAGAYAWLQYKAPYLGIQEGFVSSFFRDVLGIRTTTYNFGFRGAGAENIVSFYGSGYTEADFTRLQLYRDITVYEEMARRAKIVCADLDASVGSFVSINQWVASAQTVSRRLEAGYADMDDRKRHLKEVVPDLTDRQLEHLASSHEHGDELDRRISTCAPDFSMNCLFKTVGTRFNDF